MIEKLLKIQQELKAPKGQKNSFGGYNYRSCEDILESVKPLLKEYKCVLTLTDELVQVGERYYIKAIAVITDTESGNTYTNIAFAREEESKKGMDASQITGATSSYARKYALNGLFAIDDTKDADTDEYQKQAGKSTQKKATNRDKLIALCKEKGLNINEIATTYGLNPKSTEDDYYDVLCDLEGEEENAS